MDSAVPSTSGMQKEKMKKGNVLKKTTKKGKKFQTSWLEINEFKNWLALHPDSGKAYCTACDKILTCGKSELYRHASGARHIKAIRENPSALLPTATHNIENMDHINKVKSAEIRLAAFFAEHNIAFQIAEHMVPLIKDICSNPQIVNDLTLSRTKCAKIVQNIIAKRETEKTIENLKSQKFSILIDESTDISNNKLFCILVKYVLINDKKCITELLELIRLDATDCSAEKLYSAFEHCLISKEIPLNNIVGMACDNASVMIGIRDSFMSRLKKEVPALIVLKCICHSSAIIASKACSKLPDSCENLLHAVVTYISGSAKRSAILREFQEYFGVESRKILKLSGTRWLVLQKCVARLLDNWEVLKHYFHLEIIESKSNSAQSIFDMFNDNEIKACLLFLKYSLNFFNNFNALFQSRKILVHKLSESSEQLIKQMGQNFLLSVALRDISLDITNSCNVLPLDKIYVGPECEIFLKNNTSKFAQEVKLKCLDFYVSAVDEMVKRLPFNDIVLRGLQFLDPKLALYDEGRSTITDLSDVAIHFGDFDVTALAFEWRILPSMFNDADKNVLANLEIDEMWKKILEVKNFDDKRMFPNLEKLVDAIFSLPHSNAEAERIFSIVTDVKNKKRNVMNIDNLNAICKIRSNFQAQNIDCRSFKTVDSRHLELHNSSNLYDNSSNKNK